MNLTVYCYIIRHWSAFWPESIGYQLTCLNHWNFSPVSALKREDDDIFNTLDRKLVLLKDWSSEQSLKEEEKEEVLHQVLRSQQTNLSSFYISPQSKISGFTVHAEMLPVL